MKAKTRSSIAIAALVLLVAAGGTSAGLFTWIGGTDTNFSNSANWTPTGVPTGSDVAYFNATSYTYNAGLTAPVSLAGIRFGTGATGLTVNISGPNTLSLGTGTADSAGYGIYGQNNPGTNSINVSALDLTGPQSWYVQSGGKLDVSNAVVTSSGGAYALTKAGGGTVILRAANTFSGLVVGRKRGRVIV